MGQGMGRFSWMQMTPVPTAKLKPGSPFQNFPAVEPSLVFVVVTVTAKVWSSEFDVKSGVSPSSLLLVKIFLLFLLLASVSLYPRSQPRSFEASKFQIRFSPPCRRRHILGYLLPGKINLELSISQSLSTLSLSRPRNHYFTLFSL